MTKIGNFKVDVQYYYNSKGMEVTVAHLFNKDNQLLSKGKVTRNNKDNPCRKKAFKSVLAAALSGSKVPKKVRSEFWESFRTMTKIPRWEINSNAKTNYESKRKTSEPRIIEKNIRPIINDNFKEHIQKNSRIKEGV